MFIAESVMISTSGAEYCAFPCEDGLFDDTYDYLSVSGFVDDALVASMTLFLPSSGSSFELLPLSLLGAIDRLRVGVIAPDDPGRFWGCGRDHGCAHVDIDNIQLTPVSVPEPGTLLLFGGALAAARLLRRRGRA